MRKKDSRNQKITSKKLHELIEQVFLFEDSWENNFSSSGTSFLVPISHQGFSSKDTASKNTLFHKLCFYLNMPIKKPIALKTIGFLTLKIVAT